MIASSSSSSAASAEATATAGPAPQLEPGRRLERPRRPAVLAPEPVRVGPAKHVRRDRLVDPVVELGDVARVDRQPRRELEALRLGRPAQPLQLGPRRLRVDVVDGDGRDAAPVVDPRLEQARELVVAQVRRRLDAPLGTEQHARGRARPEQLLERRLRRVGHARPGLGAEVLDDHLLHVPVALAELADREQRLDPLLARLADPDQDPGRERHARPAGGLDRLQPPRGQLVGRAEVRPAALREPLRERLEHHALRDAHLAQRPHVLLGHDPGVQVRQQAGLLEHEPGTAGEVLERRLAAELPQLVARDAVAELRLVAEREERLVTAGGRARAGDREHLVLGQVRALAAAGRVRERAVVADVPAELRQRDEDLRREGDEPPVPGLSKAAGVDGKLLPGSLDQVARLHGARLLASEPGTGRLRHRLRCRPQDALACQCVRLK